MSEEWKPPSAGATRVANRIIRPLLNSPLHHPLSRRLMLLRYTGRKSGRQYTIPIAYSIWKNGEVLATSTRPTWMVNLRGGQLVQIRIRGRWRQAKPTIVEDRAGVADVLAEFAAHSGPRAAAGLRIGLPADRQPTRDELLRAASKVRLCRFHLTG